MVPRLAVSVKPYHHRLISRLRDRDTAYSLNTILKESEEKPYDDNLDANLRVIWGRNGVHPLRRGRGGLTCVLESSSANARIVRVRMQRACTNDLDAGARAKDHIPQLMLVHGMWNAVLIGGADLNPKLVWVTNTCFTYRHNTTRSA